MLEELYVVTFDNGITKVGRTDDFARRYDEHRRDAGAGELPGPAPAAVALDDLGCRLKQLAAAAAAETNHRNQEMS
jgi:predicted GIY-YIG superfamily endonuclease